MTPETALALTVEIGDRLLSDERTEVEATRLPWAFRIDTGPNEMEETDENPEFVRKFGDSLYLGTSGITLFLIALHGVTQDDRYLQAARRGGDGMIHRYEALVPLSPGLYIGQAGPALALIELHRATGGKRYLEAAVEQASWMAQQPTVWSDLMNGLPGYGLFFLSLSEATEENERGPWLAAARRCAQVLREKAEPLGEDGAVWPYEFDHPRHWVNPGLAHGIAGAAVFLHALARVDPSCSETGELGRRVDAALRHSAQAREGGLDWRTWIEGDRGEFLVQWCHGAPGVAIAWLSSNAEDALEMAKAAGRVTIAAGDNRRQASQCHGVCGNAETLIELYRSTGEPHWLEEAHRFAEWVLNYRLPGQGPGAFRTHDSEELTYDLMTGIAGVGYFFLRIALPNDIPYPGIGRWLK